VLQALQLLTSFNLLGDAQSVSADCVASQVKTLTHKVGVFSKRIFDKVPLGKTKGILH
jgi:hypothetical protein